MATQEVAERYFAHMRARDLGGLAELFAEHAVMVLPDGRELSGRAAIEGMYKHLFSLQPPSPTPVAFINGARGAAVEIESRLEDGSVRRTANFFHFDQAGLIERLSIYRRGD